MPVSSPFELFLLNYLLPVLPFLLVYVIGAVLCVVRWRRHPMASRFGLAAFVVFILSTLGSTAAYYWMLVAMPFGTDYREYAMLVTMLRTGAGVFAWVLLLIALFGWRADPQEFANRHYDDR
jgi:hypothetical protein